MLPEMHSAGGIAPLCSQLTKWKPQPGLAGPTPLSTPAPTSTPTSAPAPNKPGPIPMRPIVKRTDTPRTTVEHRPEIVMTNITRKPAVNTPPAKQSERPIIPMKPK